MLKTYFNLEFLGTCIYCGALGYWNPEEEHTFWKSGDPDCLHKLEQSNEEEDR